MIIDEMNARIKNRFIASRDTLKKKSVDKLPLHSINVTEQSTGIRSMSSYVPWIIIIAVLLCIACIHWDILPHHIDENSFNQQHSISDLEAQIASCNIMKTEWNDRFDRCVLDLDKEHRKFFDTEQSLEEMVDNLRACKEEEAERNDLLLDITFEKKESVERLERKVKRENAARERAEQIASTLESENQMLKAQLENQSDYLLPWYVTIGGGLVVMLVFGVVNYICWETNATTKQSLDAETTKMKGLMQEKRDLEETNKGLDSDICDKKKRTETLSTEISNMESKKVALGEAVREFETKDQKFQQLTKEIVYLKRQKTTLENARENLRIDEKYKKKLTDEITKLKKSRGTLAKHNNKVKSLTAQLEKEISEHGKTKEALKAVQPKVKTANQELKQERDERELHWLRDKKKVDQRKVEEKKNSSLQQNSSSIQDDASTENVESNHSVAPNEIHASIPTHVILVGDSVLDDFFWLDDKTRDVRRQICDLYENRVTVTNLAVDESTSTNVRKGIKPNARYVDSRKENGFEPYPVDSDGKVFSLKIIRQKIESNEIVTDIADGHIKVYHVPLFSQYRQFISTDFYQLMH